VIVNLPKPPHEGAVITLCGSTKFKEHFERYMKELSLLGWLVISVGCFAHSDLDDCHRIIEKKAMLDRVHLKKIDLSDAVLVLDVDGYIGDSTHSEFVYASSQHKDLYMLSVLEKEARKND
jgi:hypothetical protein